MLTAAIRGVWETTSRAYSGNEGF